MVFMSSEMRRAMPEAWNKYRSQTLTALRSRDWHDPKTDPYGAVAPPQYGLTGPVYTSVAYVFRSAQEAAEIFDGTIDGYAYPRLSCGTPPVFQLSQRLLELELGPGYDDLKEKYDVLLTASGMSAILALALTLTDQQPSIISSPKIYGGTYNLFNDFLPRLGINCQMVSNPLDLHDWKQAISKNPNAAFLFAEDDANPTPIKLDNKALADLAHAHSMIYVCDRTIGTPLLERPILTGTDVVIHSLSKNLGGHSEGLGGAIIGPKWLIRKIRDGWFVVMGAVMDPRVADYILYGLKNLETRLATKGQSVKQIRKYLQTHPRVSRVYSTEADLMAFELKGTLDDARRVVESYQLILFAPHLGDIRTISTHPASTTHSRVPKDQREKLGISDTLIRLSVGLEDPQDIIDDLEQALSVRS